MSRRRLLGAVLAGAVLLAACGSDHGSSIAASTIAAAASSATSTTAVASTTTLEAATTTGDEATTSTTGTTAAPTTTDALQGRPGVAPITVTITGDDPGRPAMSWEPVAGAASYELVVHDVGGHPVWGWTGEDTAVVLGGVERAADAEGPTLDGGGTVRVYALDASSALVGVSAWTPVSGG